MVQERHRELGESEAASEATANGAMRAFRLLWNFVLEKRPEFGPHPVKLKKRWHEVEPRTRLVKSEQLPAFYRAVCALPNPVHRDYMLTLLFTGMRRRECAALKWDHIDLAAKTMTIPAANAKSRVKLDLPLSDFLFDLLVARRAFGKDVRGWVFPSSNSKSGHIEEPKFALDQVEAICGIEVSPHDLRRTFVTTAERCAISGMAKLMLVNHSTKGGGVHGDSVHLTIEELREPAQLVADRLKQLCGIEAVTGNVQRLR
jgi:integrase